MRLPSVFWGSVYRHQTAMTRLSIQVEAKNILVRDPASGRSVTYRRISNKPLLVDRRF